MNSKLIVETYQAQLKQPRLFDDYDLILRNTPFQPVNPQFDYKAKVHWLMNVYKPAPNGPDERTPDNILKTWDIWYDDVFHGGYNPNTNQVGVKIKLSKNKYRSTLTKLSLWIPYIKPVEFKIRSESYSGKYIGIFEHTLSEYGCYNLLIGDTIDLLFTRFHRTEVIQTFPTLKAALKYISEHHYYQ